MNIIQMWERDMKKRATAKEAKIMDRQPEEELSEEVLLAVFESSIWEKYEELKKHFKELKITIENLKIKNKKAKEEIKAHLTLTGSSVEELKESIKILQNSFDKSLEKLKMHVISEQTLKSLEEFRDKHLRVPTEINDIIKELLNIAETHIQKNRM